MSLLSSIFGGGKETPKSSEKQALSVGVNQAATTIFDRTVELPAPRDCPTRQELKKKRERTVSHHSTEPRKERKKRKPSTDAVKTPNDDSHNNNDKSNGSGVMDDTGVAADETHKNDDDVADRTIFVGNLPLDADRKALAKLFRDCGPIVSTRIRSVAVKGIKLPPAHAGDQNLVKKVCTNTKLIDDSVKSSVQGYVVFQSTESVAKALQLNNTTVPDSCNISHGRRIRVDHSKTNYDARRSIFVGNLPYGADESTLQEHIASVCDLDIPDVEGVRIVRDKDTFLCKGFGYVLFRERQMVATALQKAAETKYMDRPLRVMVCGRRFKGKQGDYSESNNNNNSAGKKKKDQNTAPATSVGALRRVLSKQQQEGSIKKRRPRAAKKSDFKTDRKPGVSRRAAAEQKVEKRVKKIQKRITKGMGKGRIR